MKHIKLKIVSVILMSILLIFFAALMILNIMLPRYFEREAENTLLYERLLYGNRETATDEIYKQTYMSGSVNAMKPESEKRQEGTAEAYMSLSRQRAEVAIRAYCASHEITDEAFYVIQSGSGHYVFTKVFDGDSSYVLYIDLGPYISYTTLMSRILLVVLIAVALVMCTIGMRLGDRVEQAQQTQQRFFQNASHELKTPLMSIQGYAEGIRMDVIPKETATDIILEESTRMTELVEELLALSKLDACGLSSHTEVCDIRDILDDCLIGIDPLLKSKGLSPQIDFPEDPLPVLCDRAGLKRAFLNIFSNGIRYAEHHIRVVCLAEKKTVCVRISDDGCGIDSDDIAHIFDRFYTGKNGNTGIGLALTHEIISLHRGTVTAYNSGGSVFEVRLPLAS